MNTKRQTEIMQGTAVPWLCLDENENDAQDASANVILLREYNGSGPAVFIPAVMESAPDMLEALKAIKAGIAAGYASNSFITASGLVDAAIAKAEAR